MTSWVTTNKQWKQFFVVVLFLPAVWDIEIWWWNRLFSSEDFFLSLRNYSYRNRKHLTDVRTWFEEKNHRIKMLLMIIYFDDVKNFLSAFRVTNKCQLCSSTLTSSAYQYLYTFLCRRIRSMKLFFRSSIFVRLYTPLYSTRKYNCISSLYGRIGWIISICFPFSF